MPLGGYCEKCAHWVWLTAHGECAAGHPASVVRDVQQLRPRRKGDLVPGEGEYAPVATRPVRFRWWWRHSLWIAWTLTFGFANWVAFFYIGIRARRTTWTLLGFVYVAPLVLTLATLGTPLARGFFILQVFVSLASLLHAVSLRPQYRAIMFGDVPGRAVAAAPQPPALPAVERPPLPKGIDERAAEVIRAAQAQVDGVLETAGDIGSLAIRDEIGHLCHTADQILAELSLKPRKVDAARGFLTYYLDASERIVRGYADLSQRDVRSADVAQTLTRAEASLGSMQQAFDRQLESILKDTVLDLDTEIALLEKTVRMENLYDQTGGLS